MMRDGRGMHIREYSPLALQMEGYKKFYDYVRVFLTQRAKALGVRRDCNGFNKRKRKAKKKKTHSYV